MEQFNKDEITVTFTKKELVFMRQILQDLSSKVSKFEHLGDAQKNLIVTFADDLDLKIGTELFQVKEANENGQY